MKYWLPVSYGRTHDDTVPGYAIGYNTTSFQKAGQPQHAGGCMQMWGTIYVDATKGQNSGGSIMIHALFPALGRMVDRRSDS